MDERRELRESDGELETIKPMYDKKKIEI